MRRALPLALLLFASAIHAQVTDPNARYSEPSTDRPVYAWDGGTSGHADVEPTFGSRITRLADVYGQYVLNLGAYTWNNYARHHYSVDEPWNADQSLIMIRNGASNGGDSILIDGWSYLPIKNVKADCNYDPDDDRWHPAALHKNERIAVKGLKLYWYNVVTCTETKSWDLTGVFDPNGRGIGGFSGNPTSDGRYIALNNADSFVVIDMEAGPGQIWYSQIESLLDCGLPSCTMGTSSGWVTMVDAHKVLASYPYGNGDNLRVFAVSSGEHPNIHPITGMPSVNCDTDPNTSGTQAPPDGYGYIQNLAHVDVGFDPFQSGAPIVVGVRRAYCADQADLGYVIKVRVDTGTMKQVTWRGPSTNREEQAHHVSMRAVNRSGWAAISYRPDHYDGSRRYSDEVVMVSLAGPDPNTGAVNIERYAHTHTDIGSFTGEAHAVPSRDGLRLLFSSTWSVLCGSVCGSSTQPRAYVVDTWPIGE